MGKAYNRSLLFAPLTYPQGLRIGEMPRIFVQLVSLGVKKLLVVRMLFIIISSMKVLFLIKSL